MENESISENLKYSSNRAIVSQKKIKEVRARQKSEAPQNSAYCFRHYSRARQITFINELAVSKSAATNRRRKWFEIHPWPKSPVGEDDSTEYFKRSETISEAVQGGLPRKELSLLRIMQNKEALMVSKMRQKRLPLQSYEKREASSHYFISWKHKQKYSSSPDIFERDSSSDVLDSHNLNSGLTSEEWSSLSTALQIVGDESYESSDDEQEPVIDFGRDENGMYEVERILAKKRLKNGRWLYYIKWVGWPYKRSSWQARSTFGNMSETIEEFHDRERALSVVVRHEQQWSELRKVSQLHSLMRWENEINTILRQNGQQILYIHNDVDYTRRRRDFKYITANKWSAEAEACMNSMDCTLERCTCETRKCGSGENCCPANGRRYKVAIVRTETRGWGIFALEDIPSNVFVVEYVGEVLTIAEGDSRYDSMYQFELNGYNEIKYLIDAKYYGNEAAFINHSCDPNLVAVRVRVECLDQFHRIGLFSKCRISRGQELTLNYFDGKYKPKTILTPEEGSMECSCGALNCIRYWPRLSENAVDDSGSDEDDKENSFATSGL
uniref:Histone-lysine N-methyltransferase n=1 Tax=Wuchereria bancrofti TaxID=6293 RepID=A0AAF5Q6B4_WUCBA